jgi:hypothetical protein
VQLVDTETGTHLWADRFDKPISDLFDMQDEIVSHLANALDAQLTWQEAQRSVRSPHPSSMDLYFQGKALMYEGWRPEDLSEARAVFERTFQLDPRNVDARVWTAIIDAIVGSSYIIDGGMERLVAAEAGLLKALSHAPNHAFCPRGLGRSTD